MNHVFKMFRFFLAAMILVAFASPAMAAQPPVKQYSLDMQSTGTTGLISSTLIAGGGTAPVDVATTGTIVFVTVMNQTPGGGNSAINSFTLTKPNGWTISQPAGLPPSSFQMTSTGDLKVSGFTGLLPKDQQGVHGVTISIRLTPDTCAAGSITWNTLQPPPSSQFVTVYTGNFSSTTFAFVKDAASNSLNTNQTTRILGGGGCSTVTFNSNGGSAVASQTVQNNTTATQPAPDPTKTGYNFAGWYSDAGLTTQFNFSTAITTSITLYAKWTPKMYTVSFNSMGGSAVASQSVAYSSTATSPASPTKAGNTFVGWYSDAALSTPFNFGTAITADVTLYAKWSTNSYVVSFNSNGGSAVTSQTVLYNTTATQPADPAKTGYTFAGWYSDVGLSTQFNFGTAITGITTLYAKWSTNSYLVTFNSNGGSAVASQSVPYNTTTTQPANPTRNGFTFAAWYSNAGLSTQFDFATAITGNITVYAKWTENTLAIHVPATATLGTPFPVTVDVNPDGSPAVTLSSSDCTLTYAQTGTTPSLLTFSVTLTSVNDPTGHSCTITAASPGSGYSSSAATISPIMTGLLGCGQPAGNNLGGGLGYTLTLNPGIAYVGNPDWGLIRALHDKDGTGCDVPVPYQFEFDPGTNTAAFIVPNTLGEGVAVEYVLLWSPVATDTVPASYPGLPFAMAKLAWLHDISNPAAWKFVPALACVEDDVELTGTGDPAHGIPAPAPQLVMPMIPNVEPFITLGSNGYPGYAPNQLAKMCVAQEGWTAIGTDGNGQKLRQYWHKVIDNADGGAQLSN